MSGFCRDNLNDLLEEALELLKGFLIHVLRETRVYL